jgi:hypothetical protein
MGWKTREQMLAYNKKYYEENKELLIKKSREWAKKNSEKRREISRRYARKKNGTTEESYLKSDTYKGWVMEKKAIKYFPGAKHMNEYGMNKPYDIDWNGVKIDVKSAVVNKRKNKRGKPVKGEQAGYWSFTKGKNDADYYLCFCLVGQKITKKYFIPREHFGKGVCVGQISKKYDKYLFNN